jgi:hypothetical protein
MEEQAAQREAERRIAAQQEAERRIAAQQAAQQATQQQAAQQVAQAQVFPISSSEDTHMTPAQVDQVDRDIFGEAFSGIPQRPRDPFRRIARDPIQQEETLPQGITSVPAQPPNEPIRPNFNRLQPSSSSSSLQPLSSVTPSTRSSWRRRRHCRRNVGRATQSTRRRISPLRATTSANSPVRTNLGPSRPTTTWY